MSQLPGRLDDLDESLLRIARTYGHTPAAERKVARFSLLGEHAAVWLVLGTAESLRSRGERRSRWARATGAVAGTYAANTALKLVVRRVRPELSDLPPLTSTPTRFSFPSAHSSTSFAGALAYSRAGFPGAPLYALAVGLALSRLYLGVHYPSDVLAGALLGLAVAEICTRRPGAWDGTMAPGGTGVSAVPVSEGTMASGGMGVSAVPVSEGTMASGGMGVSAVPVSEGTMASGGMGVSAVPVSEGTMALGGTGVSAVPVSEGTGAANGVAAP